MLPTAQSFRILLIATNNDQATSIQEALSTCLSPRFDVEHASNGWEAQRLAGASSYRALVVDDNLSDIDGESLMGRLKSSGVGAPALLLTSNRPGPTSGSGYAYFWKSECPRGESLARAIVAMVTIHDLTTELDAARREAASAAMSLATLAHDLATPLGVVMGMSQLLLAEDSGLNADDRECLEDVSREAERACEMLKRHSPGVPAAAALPAVVKQPIAPDRADTDPGSKAVLIADDDPATRRLVRATLASDQYTVLEAADGEEAWRLIRAHHPAVAILDWQMPVYTGLELTDVIKGDPLVRGMTVIMLTGRSAAADREAGARAHADLYLSKPFSPGDLVEAVEQALGIV